MEQHGLDQVIGELKERGIKAGEAEAARIVAEANARAERIVTEANEQAAAVRKKAEADKAATLAALDAEMAQACRVGLAAFRQAIEGGFVVPEVTMAMQEVLKRPALLEQIVADMARAFAASGWGTGGVEVLLPEARRAELEQVFVGRLAARGAGGVQVRFDDSLAFGFRLGSPGGGFSFDLSDEGFAEVLVRFLSPRFRAAFYRSGDAEITRS